jgi:hypothetical protein
MTRIAVAAVLTTLLLFAVAAAAFALVTYVWF